MLNATAELAEAHRFTEIRLFTADHETSEKPLYDLKSVTQPWSLPSASKKDIVFTIKK